MEDAQSSEDIQGPKLGYWLLEHTKGTAKRAKFPSTDLSFATHSANIVRLIKTSHDAQDAEAILEAQATLQNYVLLTCCAKIYGRLARGVDDRDIFEYATTKSADLAEKMLGTDFKRLLQTRGLSQVFRDFTRRERGTASRLCKFLLDQQGGTTISEDTRNDLIKFANLLNDDDALVAYSNEVLLWLQIILSTVLDNVDRSLRTLAQFKRKAQIHKQNHDDEWPIGPSNNVAFSTDVQALDNAVEDAAAWLRGLSELIGTLGPFVHVNLAFLAIIYELTSVRRKSDDVKVKSAPRRPTTDPFTSSPRVSSAVGGSEYTHESANKEYPVNLEEKDRFYPEFKIVDGKNWEQAALTWLNLLCSHTFAYMTLSRNVEENAEDRATAELSRRTELNIVKSSSDYTDQQLYVGDYLERFTYVRAMKPTKFDDEELRLIYNWLETYGYGYSKKVIPEIKAQKSLTGIYHCETLLICLYMIGEMRQDIVNLTMHATGRRRL